MTPRRIGKLGPANPVRDSLRRPIFRQLVHRVLSAPYEKTERFLACTQTPDAIALVVNGFFEAFVKELPLEYAVELNRLIQLEMEGAVG